MTSAELRQQTEIDAMRRDIAMLWALLKNGRGDTTIEGGGGILIKLTSNATGGGWYNGVIWDPPATAPDGTVTLTEAQLGSSGDSVVVCNLLEVTKNTHDLKFSGTPTPYQHVFLCTPVVAEDEDVFYVIQGWQWGCS